MKPVCLATALLLFGLWSVVNAQTPPDTLWARAFGGEYFDAGTSIKKTADGGFIVAGSTKSYGSGGADAWLVKINGDGTMAWNRVYGGSGDDNGGFVEQTADGGYIVAGLSKSFGNGKEDVWLFKTNEHGDSLWSRIFGGPEDDRAQSVSITPDGGYIIAGGTGDWVANNQDAWLIRTDSVGDVIWEEKYGGAGNEKAYMAQQTSDGGYVFAGFTSSFGSGGYDMWLLKTNASGDSLWDRTFGGIAIDNAYNMMQTADSGYVLAGYTQSFGSGGYDVWLIKTDENGNEEWNKIFGETGDEVAYDVQQTAGGNYILAGLTESFGAVNFDALLIKTDQYGNEVWKNTFGGSGNEYVFSVDQADDGGYVATGYSNSFSGQQDDDLYVFRLEADEPIVTTTAASFDSRWTGSCVEIDWCLTDDIGQTAFEVSRRELPVRPAGRVDGELIQLGDKQFRFHDCSTQPGKRYNYRVDVIESGVVIASFETNVNTPSLGIALGRNFPNPFNTSARIDFTLNDNQRVILEIYDIDGKRVKTLLDKQVSPGEHTTQWDGRNSAGAAVASGVYFVKFKAGKTTYSRKLTLVK